MIKPWNASIKHNTLYIETPFNLSEDMIGSLQSKLAPNTDSPIKIVINPDVLGGFLAKFKGVKTDATLRRQLQEVSTNLLT